MSEVARLIKSKPEPEVFTATVIYAGRRTVDVRLENGTIYRNVPIAGGAGVNETVRIQYNRGKPMALGGGSASGGSGGGGGSSSGGTGGGGGGAVPSPHDLDGPHHSGQLNPNQANWAVKTDGTRSFTGAVTISSGALNITSGNINMNFGNLVISNGGINVVAGNISMGNTYTVDGVDISDFKARYDILKASNFIVVGSGSSEMSNERALTVGNLLLLSDGGANSTISVAVDPTKLTISNGKLDKTGAGLLTLRADTSEILQVSASLNLAGNDGNYLNLIGSLDIMSAGILYLNTFTGTLQATGNFALGSANAGDTVGNVIGATVEYGSNTTATANHSHKFVTWWNPGPNARPLSTNLTGLLELKILQVDGIAFIATATGEVVYEDRTQLGVISERWHQFASGNVMHFQANTTETLQISDTGYAYALRLGAGLPGQPAYTLQVQDDTEQFRVQYDDVGHYMSIFVDSGGNAILSPSGDWVFNPAGKDILPQNNFDLNLGKLDKMYLTLWVAELWAQTLVAQDVMATIGGRILVAPSNVLVLDLPSGGTTTQDVVTQRGTATSASIAGGVAAAIAYRASSSGSVSAGNNITLNLPTGTTTNDFLIAEIVEINGASPTPPSGWTEITAIARSWAVGVDTAYVKYYWKVAGGSEPSTYVWAVGATNNIAGIISCYYNVNTSSPINGSASQANSSSANIVAPSVTTTQNECMVVYFAAMGDTAAGSGSITPPSGTTERAEPGTGSLNVRAETADVIQSVAGSTGTLTGVSTTAYKNAGATIVLNPASPSSSSITITKPTGTVQFDLMVAAISVYGTPTITPPAGWTLLFTRSGLNGSLNVYWKLAGASEGANYNWATNATGAMAGTIISHFNVNQSTPIDNFSSQSNSVSVSMTSPSVLSAVNLEQIMFIGAGLDTNAGTVTATATSGYTEKIDTGAGNALIYLATKQTAAAGSNAAVAMTLSSAIANIGAQVLIRPSYTSVGTSFLTVKYNNFGLNVGSEGDILLMQKFPRIEFMQVLTHPTADYNQNYTLSFTGVPTGGTFKLTRGAISSANINWNDSASTMLTKLEAMSNIGAGNVSVAGTVGGPFLIQFISGLANTAITLTVTSNALTGTGSPTPVLAGSIITKVYRSFIQDSKTVYEYRVSRDLDGTGSNDWYAGDSAVNTGHAGNGFIDLYSLYGVPHAGQTNTQRAGPTIVGNVRKSTTFNDFRERWAIGNLNGLYAYGNDEYGMAAGDPVKTWVAADGTNGFRIVGLDPVTSAIGVVLAQWDIGGNLRIGRNAAAKPRIYLDATTGVLSLGVFNVDKITLDGATGNMSLLGSLSVGTAGNIRIGQTAYNTGTGLFAEYNAGVPRFSIGNPAGTYLIWDGVTLTVNGVINVTGGSAATTTNVSDSQALAISTSSAYTNKRRVAFITGTWGSTAYNVFTWTTGTVVMADGITTKTVVNVNFTMPSQAIYKVYIDVEAGAGQTALITSTGVGVGSNHVLIAEVIPSFSNTVSPASISVVGNTTSIGNSMIATNAIRADNIQANSITSDKIQVGVLNDNLIINGSFEDITASSTPSSWIIGEGTNYGWGITSADKVDGNYSMYLTKGAANVATMSRAFPIVQGETYIIRLKIRSDNAVNGLSYLRMFERSTYPVGGYVIVPTGGVSGWESYTDIAANLTVTPSGFALGFDLIYQYTPSNSGMKWASFTIYNLPAGASTNIYIDAVEVRRQFVSTNIKDGAITTDKIFALAITANKIAARAITADKIDVGVINDNLIINGSFEGPLAGTWFASQSSGTGGSFSQTTNDKTDGDYSLAIFKNDSAAGFSVTSRAFPVNPGDSYMVRARQRTSASTGSGYYLQINYKATYPAGDSVTYALRDNQNSIVNNAAGTTAFTTVGNSSYVFTVPAGAYWASVALYNWTNASSAYALFDEVEVRKQLGNVHIEDGAITATKISVVNLQAVSADMGTLSAGEILLGNATTFGAGFTGLRMFKSGVTYQLIGYNAGTPQAYFDSDGKLYAGGGLVLLDAGGIRITSNGAAALTQQNKLSFKTAGGVEVGYMGAYRLDSNHQVFRMASALSGTDSGNIEILATSPSSSFIEPWASITLQASGTDKTASLVVSSLGVVSVAGVLNLTGNMIGSGDISAATIAASSYFYTQRFTGAVPASTLVTTYVTLAASSNYLVTVRLYGGNTEFWKLAHVVALNSSVNVAIQELHSISYSLGTMQMRTQNTGANFAVNGSSNNQIRFDFTAGTFACNYLISVVKLS